MEIIILCLLIELLIILNIYILVKFNKLTSSKTSSAKMSRDFEKDFMFLEKSIKDNFEYFKNTLLSSLKSKKTDSLLKDNEANEIITQIVINIEKDLSDEYKELLSYYINDLDYYITKRINSLIVPYLIGFNLDKLY